MKRNEGKNIADYAKAMRLDAMPIPAQFKNLRRVPVSSKHEQMQEQQHHQQQEPLLPPRHVSHFEVDEFSFISFDSQEDEQDDRMDWHHTQALNQIDQEQQAQQNGHFMQFTGKDIAYTLSDENDDFSETSQKKQQLVLHATQSKWNTMQMTEAATKSKATSAKPSRNVTARLMTPNATDGMNQRQVSDKNWVRLDSFNGVVRPKIGASLSSISHARIATAGTTPSQANAKPSASQTTTTTTRLKNRFSAIKSACQQAPILNSVPSMNNMTTTPVAQRGLIGSAKLKPQSQKFNSQKQIRGQSQPYPPPVNSSEGFFASSRGDYHRQQQLKNTQDDVGKHEEQPPSTESQSTIDFLGLNQQQWQGMGDADGESQRTISAFSVRSTPHETIDEIGLEGLASDTAKSQLLQEANSQVITKGKNRTIFKIPPTSQSAVVSVKSMSIPVSSLNSTRDPTSATVVVASDGVQQHEIANEGDKQLVQGTARRNNNYLLSITEENPAPMHRLVGSAVRLAERVRTATESKVATTPATLMTATGTTKVFCMNSQDEHIRRALLKRGWKEGRVASGLFDLKWIYIDSNDDYKMLVDNQYYNHFRNNQEITSKGRLLHNLKNYAQPGVNVDEFFPRCYDLGTEGDRQAFAEQFHRINMLILVENHLAYCRQRRPEWLEEIERAFEVKQEMKAKLDDHRRERLFQRKKRKIFGQANPLRYEDTSRDSTFIVNTTIIGTVIECLKRLKAQHEDLIDETGEGMAGGVISGRNQQLLSQQTNSEGQLRLVNWVSQYVRIKAPFNEEKFLFDKIVGMGKEFWSTPSKYLMSTLYKLREYFSKTDAQFQSGGFKNIWIIKPAANSRGQGISLVSRLDDAIECGMQMSARIVQKYIERPLIFPSTENNKYGVLGSHKFDIRQWVLVKSVQPLQLYYFKNAYLRVCSGSFELDNIKNLAKHLTNFSVNKHAVKKENWDETVVELKDFAALLKAHKGVDYYEVIEPQIKAIAVTTLKAAADRFVHRQKSFELLGFDILIDEDTKPWLLEVNMSPACAERAPFLSRMLDDMAEGLLKIILEEESDGQPQIVGSKATETVVESSHHSLDSGTHDDNGHNTWELLYDEATEDDYQADACVPSAVGGIELTKNADFMVVGHKVDSKKERALDRKYFQYWAAITIQTHIRSFLARKMLLFLRHTKYAIVLQKYSRRFLCVQLKIRKRKYRAATKIQCMIRRWLAMRLLIRLRRHAAALRIQCWSRMLAAKQVAHHLLRVKCAMKIQAKWRQLLSKAIAKKRKKFMLFIKRVQIKQRARFNLKWMAATVIQSNQRMVQAKTKLVVLRKRYQSAVKIQKHARCLLAKKRLEQLRIKAIISRVYFGHKKKLLHTVMRLARARRFACLVGSKVISKVLSSALCRMYQEGEKRNQAALRIQGMLKVKKAKRQKKRNYRLRLLIKVQRRFRAFRQRCRFLRHLQAKRIAGQRVLSFLRICVAKRKLFELKQAYIKHECEEAFRLGQYDEHDITTEQQQQYLAMTTGYMTNNSRTPTAVFNNYYDGNTSTKRNNSQHHHYQMNTFASASSKQLPSRPATHRKAQTKLMQKNHQQQLQQQQQQFARTFTGSFRAQLPQHPPRSAAGGSRGGASRQQMIENQLNSQQQQYRCQSSNKKGTRSTHQLHGQLQQQQQQQQQLQQQQQQPVQQFTFEMTNLIQNYDVDEEDEELLKLTTGNSTISAASSSSSQSTTANNTIRTSYYAAQLSGIDSASGYRKFQSSIPIVRRPGSFQQ